MSDSHRQEIDAELRLVLTAIEKADNDLFNDDYRLIGEYLSNMRSCLSSILHRLHYLDRAEDFVNYERDVREVYDKITYYYSGDGGRVNFKFLIWLKDNVKKLLRELPCTLT